MANIFVNGLNSKIGGGKSILSNYCKILSKNESEHNFYILTPENEAYRKYSSDTVHIVEIKAIYGKSLFFPWLYNYEFARILNNLKIDVVFNLADIPIATSIPQVFLFDWPYGVYPESVVWKMMDIKSLLTRKTKLFFFKKNLKFVSSLIAQTSEMKERLSRLYNFSNIKIVPNAVSIENIEEEAKNHEFNFPPGNKLLYLSYYYPHKNLEIFIPIAKEIRRRNLEYKIIITISEAQHAKAKILLQEIDKENLQDIIINIGPVDMSNVPSLYRQCDALLMPTLLESFSGTYVEAMHHRLPILTSDIGFATSVCGDAAIYFNPLKADSILEKIEDVFNNDNLRIDKIEKGKEILSNMPDWEQAYQMYSQIIEESIS